MTATLKRLYGDFAEDRDLVRQARAINQRRAALKRDIAMQVALLVASEDKSIPKRDWTCGCIEVGGILWRDCKAAVVASTSDGTTRGDPKPRRGRYARGQPKANKSETKAPAAECKREGA